jgi:polar amino acid transport system substrate-binding protein
MQNSHMGYTFHKSTDPRILEPLRKALDELRADGTVDQIYAKYLGN